MKRKKTAAAKHKAKIKARRPVHKKFLLHPVTIFMLICVGVLLIGWTLNAKADGPTDSISYGVHGRIPAPALTESAIITSPVSGDSFKETEITVKGSCPDSSYVKLYRNDVFAGVANCSGRVFSITTSMVQGTNSFLAKDFNITDDEGPAGTAIVVTYSSPQPVTPPQASPTGLAIQPFLINSEYQNKTYLVGQKVIQHLSVSGGVSPYALSVEWGDNKSNTYLLKDSSDVQLEHIYTKAGNFIIVVRGVDSAGQTSELQLLATVKSNDTLISTVGTILVPPAPWMTNLKKWLWVAWPAYAVVGLMSLSFWLGERQEYLKLAHPRRFQR